MRTLIFILAICAAAFGVPEIRYTVWWQSNAAGLGTPPYTATVDSAFMFRTDQWIHMDDPTSPTATDSASFSPGLANYLSNGNTRSVGMIPCASGGTDINQWQKGNASNLYLTMKTRSVNAGGAQYFIGWGGEKDAGNKTPADSFVRHVNRFIDSVRKDFSDTTNQIKFLFVVPHNGQKRYPYWSLQNIKKAYKSVQDTARGIYCVTEAAAFGHKGDSIHVNTAGLTKIGIILANAIKYLRGESTFWRSGEITKIGSVIDSHTVKCEFKNYSGQTYIGKSGFDVYSNGNKMAIDTVQVWNDSLYIKTQTAIDLSYDLDVRVFNGLLPNVTDPVRTSDTTHIPVMEFLDSPRWHREYVGFFNRYACKWSLNFLAWSKGNAPTGRTTGAIPNFSNRGNNAGATIGNFVAGTDGFIDSIGAVKFTSTNRYIAVPSKITIDDSSLFTFDIWFNPSSYNVQNRLVQLSKGTKSFSIQLLSKKLYMSCNLGTAWQTATIPATDTVIANELNHLLVSKIGKRIYAFLNNKRIIDTLIENIGTGTEIFDTVFVGNLNKTGSNQFQGLIYNVSQFNQAFDSTRYAELHNLGASYGLKADSVAGNLFAIREDYSGDSLYIGNAFTQTDTLHYRTIVVDNVDSVNFNSVIIVDSSFVIKSGAMVNFSAGSKIICGKCGGVVNNSTSMLPTITYLRQCGQKRRAFGLGFRFGF